MPFSNYAVDPAHIETMRTAFNKVCATLELNCAREDRATELVAMKIVQFAKLGVHDSDELCRLVLQDFKAQQSSSPRSNDQVLI
jgi:hypothetical protein